MFCGEREWKKVVWIKRLFEQQMLDNVNRILGEAEINK